MSLLSRLLILLTLGLTPSVFAPPLANTGVATDLAIDGPGWFVVRDPETGDLLYQRLGDFRIDSNGFLVNPIGQRVQGFCDLGRTIIGDIRVEDSLRPVVVSPMAFLVSAQVETNGDVRLKLSDNSEYVRGQILLQDFASPNELERISHHLYANSRTAGMRGSLAAPGTQGLGKIMEGALEITPTLALLKPIDPTRPAAALATGVITRTANPTDLAIRGAGFFLVRDPVTSELFATRAGAFLWDSNNFLITYDRKRVQGRITADPSAISDVRVELPETPTRNPLAAICALTFRPNGDVFANLDDGTIFNIARVKLWTFSNPGRLTPARFAQYAGVSQAIPREIDDVGRFAPESSRIEQGLELINVTPDLLERRHQMSWFPQGALKWTGRLTDLAIGGSGFFMLRDPRNNQKFATRDGRFHFDMRGFLINQHGLRVQGYLAGSVSHTNDVRVDWLLRTPGTGRNAKLTSCLITRDGWLNLYYSDGTEFRPGAVMLMTFGEPFRLRPVGNRLYSGLEAAGPRPLVFASQNGTGDIQSSAIELLPDQEALQLPQRDRFRIGITGEPGSRWTIQGTEDFLTWQTVGVITNAPFESEFCDVSARPYSHRFYRVVAEYASLTNGLTIARDFRLLRFQLDLSTNYSQPIRPLGTNLFPVRP